MRGLLISLTVLMCMAASPVKAMTTIYTDSSAFGAWPDAVNAASSLGAADGVAATVPNGGWIAYQVAPTFESGTFLINASSVVGAGTALFYVGRTDGAGFFSNLTNQGSITLTTGPNLVTASATSQAFCISIGGCDVFVVQAFGGGTTLGLDRVLGPSPEPAVWALMILGFIGVASRVKILRRQAGKALAPAFA